MQEVTKKSWASAYKNKEFIFIETSSGYRSSHGDPKGKQHMLGLDVDDLALGNTLLDALAHSRFLLPKDDPDLFSYEKTAERYQQWVTEIMAHYGYKSRRAMFKDMQTCGIEKKFGLITILPSNHDRLEGWSGTGIKETDHVVISEHSSPSEIGAALRLAFSRCR
ncbi:MAG: contact-dependent growth inhibition system immunity protein [Candidatus Symbiodolus clandestinus]